jgi:hypothetical protein
MGGLVARRLVSTGATRVAVQSLLGVVTGIGSFGSGPSSADFQSAPDGKIRLARRLLWAGQPAGSRRYSRLEICATWLSYGCEGINKAAMR